jgi:plastocyanin
MFLGTPVYHRRISGIIITKGITLMEATMKLLQYSVITLAILFLCSVAAYSADSKDTHEHGTWKEKRIVAKADADGVQRVEIVGGDYYYDPNYIVVKVNKPVELKVKKAASYIPHNLLAKSPEAGIVFNFELKGDQQVVKFTPTKTGKYPIYCDKSLLWFKTHREKGMEGLIEVVE